MTQIVKVKTGSAFEQSGSYSRVVAVDNWIFVSNTAGRNPDTKQISEDLFEQTEQVFSNIERGLKAVDASLADVVSTRVFIQDPADVAPVMELFGAKFKGIDPTTTVTCPPLGSTVYKVEIEVTAYRGAAASGTEYVMA
ncbi:Enamine deaminase RidA, house cleaning of reactive enamine intermediates, YjgF/YER057c/UK114 family [Vibrio xiamenensis]|uniref:Enamine deaminase RidA, house cleaning of reactive enamine intermediates, YjgF/YER057c/UK114 family n=1 Tax=Vibrio xiamenensis TaxID=861298 RepID=A0A1G7WYB1_9VIBR|nr:RidA family protein [Vibrio xiamenensis]SDG76885.1 Enamine deaminase RidA, house cleaning of reactive enamine intermediates, YjgF/YER057c/UK114 family [Vibrio xiamenensis]SDG88238.1 Enamine deaminase RidA, house cleaning of reactive enamine intermediates, YjgF/YER057c/UK114 family [Vibrio xiamenensis]